MQGELDLGPFELGEAIQSGGMAVIHRGTHRQSGALAAIKVIKPDQLGSASRLRALRREINTIAALDHPHIVRLFDLGEVSHRASIASNGRLPEGAPWYAMEFVNGGSLLQAPPPRSWAQIKRWLIELLDALAHAHAAGVIHRDLKPGNILLDRDEGGRERIKLVDFGIAQLLSDMEAEQLGEQTSEINVSGTPRYMAPEQVSGRHREQGPWTDLYAFGCVAWFLLCGSAPFTGSMIQIMRHHIYSETPTFSPLFTTPTGFEAWIARLLEKSPSKRFRRAADAAAALLDLGEPTIEDEDGLDDETQELDMSALRAAVAYKELEPTSSLSTLSFLKQSSAPPEAMSEQMDPDATGQFVRSAIKSAAMLKSIAHQIPRNWESLTPMKEPQRGLTSLGLLSLREPPMIGRVAERDILWTQLRRVAMTQTPRLVFIEGHHGAGATRLASWLSRRAHEVGATIQLSATHDPNQDALGGLRGMLTAHLRCAGLSGEKLRRHLKRICVEDESVGMLERDLEPLAALLEPAREGDEAEAAEQFTIIRDQSSRHALVARLIRSLGRERPVLLELDDVHWAPETLLLLEYLLHETQSARLPLLIVCTVNTERLLEAPFSATILDRLRAHSASTSVELLPLSARDQRALIDAILPLEPNLATELARRTEGRPGFAIQLIDAWNRQGALSRGVDGFELDARSEEALPDGLQEIWNRRLAQLFKRLPDDAREDSVVALEVAATLGRHVRAEEWRVACMFANTRAHETCLDAMISLGLAVPTEDGFSFAHKMLQEALYAQAQQARRVKKHHRHCASMLETIYTNQHPRRLLRRAHHHHLGGDWDAAQALLVIAASLFERLASFTQALEALDLRARSLAELSTRESPAWIANQLERARLELRLQRMERASQKLEDLRARGLLDGIRDTPLGALHRHVKLLDRFERGKLARVCEERDALLAELQRGGEDPHALDALRLVGMAHELLGEISTATNLYDAMQRHDSSRERGEKRSLALLGAISCALAREDLARTEQLLDEALGIFSSLSQLEGLFHCAWFEAHICMLGMRAGAARAATEAILPLLPQFDSPMRAAHFIQLLLLDLEIGQLDEATECVEELTRISDLLNAHQEIHYQAALCAYHAAKRAPGEAARRYEIVLASVRRIGLNTPRLADALALFARHVRIDRPELADDATARAVAIYEKLGSHTRQRRLLRP